MEDVRQRSWFFFRLPAGKCWSLGRTWKKGKIQRAGRTLDTMLVEFTEFSAHLSQHVHFHLPWRISVFSIHKLPESFFVSSHLPILPRASFCLESRQLALALLALLALLARKQNLHLGSHLFPRWSWMLICWSMPSMVSSRPRKWFPQVIMVAWISAHPSIWSIAPLLAHLGGKIYGNNDSNHAENHD